MSGKNGFSIVEVAIVMVGIGIIVGMAIQLLALKDAAEMKSDVARMAKFAVAIRTYYADNLKLPPAMDTTGRINPDNLTGAGYLVDSERLSAWDRKYWNFFRCVAGADNSSHTMNPNGQAVCMALESSHVSHALSCSLEVQLDDENYEQGLGRAIPAISIPAGVQLRECDNSTGFGTYYYRVF